MCSHTSSDGERHLLSLKCFSEASMCLCMPFIWRSLQYFGKCFLFLFQFFSYTAIPKHLLISQFNLTIDNYANIDLGVGICVLTKKGAINATKSRNEKITSIAEKIRTKIMKYKVEIMKRCTIILTTSSTIDT